MENDKEIWMIENKKKVSFQLDQHHKLYVERVSGGFTLKVFDDRGQSHSPNEPIILFSNKISDTQLGYKVVEE